MDEQFKTHGAGHHLHGRQSDGKPVGGIMSMPPGAEELVPNWGTFVTVNDVDSVAVNAQQLGKLLLEPKDIPNVGRFCVIQDRQGAVISAITYANP